MCKNIRLLAFSFLFYLLVNIFYFIRFKIYKGKRKAIGNNKSHKVFVSVWVAHINKFVILFNCSLQK